MKILVYLVTYTMSTTTTLASIFRHVGPTLFLKLVTNEQQYPFLHFVAHLKMFKARF